MAVARSARTRPLSLTADPLNSGVTFAVDFAGDDGVAYVGVNGMTKAGALSVIDTSVGTASGRDVSNGGASGINQYKWADATKMGVPTGVGAFTFWVRLRTPTAVNASPNIREVVRLTNGTVSKLSINQYELSSGYAGYGVRIIRDNGAANLIDYTAASAIIPANTVYDLHISRDATGAFKVYINGVLRASGTGFTSDFTIVAGSAYCYFGAVNFGTSNAALIDSMVWNRQLADTEVSAQQADPYSFQTNAVVDTLTLSSPASGATVGANIVINGTSSTTGGIEASFNGGAWQTIVAANGGGPYSGTLAGQAAGTGTLTVRLVGKTLTATATNITVSTASITITSPVARQAFQRAISGATIPVTVTYVQPTANIEARYNGGAWQSFAVTTSPQTINITGASKGEGPVDVRFKESIGVSASVANVAVTNVFLTVGQSNSSGRGNQNNVYIVDAGHPGITGHLFANATASAIGVWGDLLDPTDTGGAGESVNTSDGANAGGSAWPLVATHLISAGMPGAFIPAAKGGTGIVNYAKTNGLDTTTAYGYAVTRALQAGSKYALYYQGESDAQAGTSQASFQSSLDTLVTNFWNDAGIRAVIGLTHYWTGQSNAAVDAIRAAQQWVIANNPHAIQGPDLLGANTGGDIHFLATSEMQTVADRWYTSLQAAGLDTGDYVSTATVNSGVGMASAVGYSANVISNLPVNAKIGAASAVGLSATIASNQVIATNVGNSSAVGLVATVKNSGGIMSFTPSASRTIRVKAASMTFDGGAFWNLSNPKIPIGTKDPDATIDITFDWSDVLTDIADTINRADFILKTLVDGGSMAVGNLATVFVSAGALTGVEPITCRITTNSVPPRVEERTVNLSMVQL